MIRLFILLWMGLRASGSTEEAVTFSSVKREINLRSQLVQITTDIEVLNNGTIALEKIEWIPDRFGNLSYINAQDGLQTLALEEFTSSTDQFVRYYIILLPSLKPSSSVTLKIYEVLTDSLTPFPSEIKQNEHQYAMYRGNLLLYTPYNVLSQKTNVLVSAPIEGYEPKNTFTVSNNQLIQTDDLKNTPGLSFKPLMVHFMSDMNFVKITNMVRNIEVSQWGSISIEEKIDLYHAGAKLKGGFSRIETGNMKDPNAVHYIMTIIPSKADGVYYKDDIGNISTSYVVDSYEYAKVIVKFRFPLFGGWKTKYTFGYTVPGYDYLTGEDDKYVLSMPLVYYVMNNMHIVHLETNIILPVTADIVEAKFPYKVETSLDVVYQKFDQIGRKVIKIEKDNVVNDHIKNFSIKYRWNLLMLLYEPLAFALGLYIIFLGVIVFLRIDFSWPVDDFKQVRLKIKSRAWTKKVK